MSIFYFVFSCCRKKHNCNSISNKTINRIDSKNFQNFIENAYKFMNFGINVLQSHQFWWTCRQNYFLKFYTVSSALLGFRKYKCNFKNDQVQSKPICKKNNINFPRIFSFLMDFKFFWTILAYSNVIHAVFIVDLVTNS